MQGILEKKIIRLQHEMLKLLGKCLGRALAYVKSALTALVLYKSILAKPAQFRKARFNKGKEPLNSASVNRVYLFLNASKINIRERNRI